MANRYAVANGNWSSTATWDGGTLPGAADIVRPNGFAVTIDQNITVTALRNDASAPAAAGGTFTLTGNYTLNISSDIQCFATSLLTYNGTGTAYITKVNSGSAIISSTTTNNTDTVTHSGTGTLIVDMVMNSAISNEINRNNIKLSGTGTLTCVQALQKGGIAGASGVGSAAVNITGVGAILNANGGCNNGANNCSPIIANILCTINVNGNVSGNWAIIGNSQNPTPATINIVGNVTSTSIYIIQSSGTLNITGNVSSGSGNNAVYTTGTATITGNLTGGSAGAAILNTGNLTVIGTINGGTSNGQVGVSTTGGTLNHIGIAQASSFGSAIACNNPTTATVTCTGPFLRNGYIIAIASQTLRINSAYNPYFEFKKSDATNVTYVDQSTSNFPAIGDVRNGTSYASGIYTGTLKVPTAAQVLSGIPIDNTTGTLLMTPAQFWNYLISNGFTTGSIGERLQNASTVATTGGQIASYNI